MSNVFSFDPSIPDPHGLPLPTNAAYTAGMGTLWATHFAISRALGLQAFDVDICALEARHGPAIAAQRLGRPITPAFVFGYMRARCDRALFDGTRRRPWSEKGLAWARAHFLDTEPDPRARKLVAYARSVFGDDPLDGEEMLGVLAALRADMDDEG
jgi:hypothetical protein